jgi:hypothetical protein
MHSEMTPDGLEQENPGSGSWQVFDGLWVNIEDGIGEFTLSYTWGRPSPRVDWLQYYPLKEIRFPSSLESLSLLPKLADRPMVAKINRPLYLPSGQGIKMIIGTPVWIRFQQAEDQLIELSTVRLSDTWFGPDTQHGELCYASETQARFTLDGVQTSPWKAFTPVQLLNSGEDGIHIERINIPVPNLTLYQGGSRFWTSPVRVTRTSSADMGEVRVSGKPPDHIANPVEIAGPRKKLEGGVVKRAMGLLFG